jgi:hypothetical protein
MIPKGTEIRRTTTQSTELRKRLRRRQSIKYEKQRYEYIKGEEQDKKTNNTLTNYTLSAGRPDHDQQHCYYHAPTVKTRGCYCSC